MAGLIKHFVGKDYPFGNYKLAPEATSGTQTGAFVTIDHSEKEFDLPTDDAKGALYFVANENDPLVPHNVDYRTTPVLAGAFVKAKPVLNGEVYETTLVGTTYATVAVDDVMGVGADGKVYLIAGLTASDFTTFEVVFTVTEKKKLWGLDSLVLVADTNQKTA